jgi:hypothetical protein
MRHITRLIDYKCTRNEQVHRAYWNITPYVPRLEQRQNALALLNIVNQSRAFSEAFHYAHLVYMELNKCQKHINKNK